MHTPSHSSRRQLRAGFGSEVSCLVQSRESGCWRRGAVYATGASLTSVTRRCASCTGPKSRHCMLDGPTAYPVLVRSLPTLALLIITTAAGLVAADHTSVPPPGG